MAKPEEFALKVFWDKRKRDAGKMAEATPLKPNPLRGASARRASTGARRATCAARGPFSLFFWGPVVIAVVSVVAAFAYKNAYSPGPLSSRTGATIDGGSDPGSRSPRWRTRTRAPRCHSFTCRCQRRAPMPDHGAGFKSTVSQEHDTPRACRARECHVASTSGTAPFPACSGWTTAARPREPPGRDRQGRVDRVPPHELRLSQRRARQRTSRSTRPTGVVTSVIRSWTSSWSWTGWSDEKWKEKSAAADRVGHTRPWARFHILKDSGATGSPQERVQRTPNATRRASSRVEPHGWTRGQQRRRGLLRHLSQELQRRAARRPRRPAGFVTTATADGKFENWSLAADKPNCISCHVQHHRRGASGRVALLTTDGGLAAFTTAAGARRMKKSQLSSPSRCSRCSWRRGQPSSRKTRARASSAACLVGYGA